MELGMCNSSWGLRHIALIPLLLVALLGACTESRRAGPQPDGWTTTIDTLPTGVVRVVNTPPLGGERATHSVIEDLRIGTFEGGGPTSFAQLKGLAVTDDGHIAVLDAMAQEIRRPGATF
jgi:hypothetical protein